MNKIDIMKELLNLYEQRDAITVPCSQIIVDKYIRKLEIKLMQLLQKRKVK